MEGEAKRYKLYTKTGDDGSSCLYTMERRAKDDAVFCALGDVDELNSAVGLARVWVLKSGNAALAGRLAQIQSRLLDVGSAVATPLDGEKGSEAKFARAAFGAEHADVLEGWIDELDGALPPLRNFILPGGGAAGAQLHVARTVCRRVERAVTPLVRQGALDGAVAVYLNRLSDFFFAAARSQADHDDEPETVYCKPAEATAE